MRFVLIREGSFSTANFTTTTNQCGHEGTRAFRYICVLEVEGQLNRQGFVIDNNDVQAYFDEVYGRRQPAISCERIAERAVHDIYRKLLLAGRDVLSIRVSISGSALAWLRAEWRKGDAIQNEQPTNDNERESELWTVA